MHVFVSLPLDARVEEDVLLANIRKGLGPSGKNCDTFFLPPIEPGSIDSLFDAEEKATCLEALLGGICRSYFSVHAEISSTPLSSTGVLGKSFDHFVKSFKWQTDMYPPSASMLQVLGSIKEEADMLLEQFKEKSKQHAEDKKRASFYFTDNASIYTADISAVAYSGEPSNTPFLSKYYIGIRDSLKEKDIKQLDQAEGIFVESLKPVIECQDGAIYEVLGKSKSPEKVHKQIEALGYCVRVPMESLKAYQQHLAYGNKARRDLARTEEKFLLMISGRLQRLIILMLHTNYLSLYIESILRFGLPASFVFCVMETSSADKALPKWRRLVQSWKYSKRVSRPNKPLAGKRSEAEYEFVYRVMEVYNFYEEDHCPTLSRTI